MTYPKQPVILQIIPELSAGGAERTSVEIAAAIAKAEGKALVVSEGGRLVQDLVEAGGQFLPFPAATKNPARILANARALAKLAKQHDAQLIHARSRAPAWSARLSARMIGVPFVTTYHGIYNQSGRLKGWYNGIMAAGDIVIANSHFTASIVHKRHHTPLSRLRVIHRGVDLSVFDPAAVSEDRAQALRALWRIAPHERIVLFAARLTRWKGQTQLIDAVARIKQAPELSDTVFVLAGDAQGRGRYEQELHQRLAEQGLSGKFRLPGHCSDMPAAFKSSTIAIAAPIEPEAFGRVAVEAQAMGCPVIASDIGALGETLSPEARQAGWLIPPGDADALAQALLRALSQPQSALATLGEKAAVHARAHFSIRQMQEKTLSVYDELLGTGLACRFATYG